MLVPKLLISGIAGITGISCLAPLTIAIEVNKDLANVWRVSSRTTFPILTCSDQDSQAKVWISLKLKEDSNNLTDNKEIVFVGEGNTVYKKWEIIDLYDKVVGPQGTFQLMIWESGKNVFAELGGRDSHKFGEKLVCDTKVFKEKRESDASPKQVEKGFVQIKLTLADCQNRVCSIKIDDEVGFEWSDEFKPKVIIQ